MLVRLPRPVPPQAPPSGRRRERATAAPAYTPPPRCTAEASNAAPCKRTVSSRLEMRAYTHEQQVTQTQSNTYAYLGGGGRSRGRCLELINSRRSGTAPAQRRVTGKCGQRVRLAHSLSSARIASLRRTEVKHDPAKPERLTVHHERRGPRPSGHQKHRRRAQFAPGPHASHPATGPATCVHRTHSDATAQALHAEIQQQRAPASCPSLRYDESTS